MELFISQQDLIARRERREALWFAPASDGGDMYWDVAARGDDDSQLLLPSDLLQFLAEGEERTLHIEVLSFTCTDYWAARTWVDDAVDIIIIDGFPGYPKARVFGPRHPGGTRFQLGGYGEQGLTCLSGRIWYFLAEDGSVNLASAWPGAMGLMV